MAKEIILPELELEALGEENPNAEKIQSTEDLGLRRETDLGFGKVRATPAARRLAKEHHMIIENIVGTGPNGRIQIENVESVLEAQPLPSRQPEPVVISSELEEIFGHPENYLGGRKEKEKLTQRVPGLAKFMSIVDDFDLKPRLDTREPDGRVVPGELSSIKRFQENDDDFTGDYGEYVRVLPKREQALPEMDTIEESVPLNRNEILINMSETIEKTEMLNKTSLSEKQKIITDSMIKSNLENAVITLTIEIDMTEVKNLRKKVAKKIEDQNRCRCTFTDFLIRAVSRSLIKYPEINSSLIDGEIIKNPDVHMGLAVDMDDGLIVPVIKNTHEMSFAEIVKNRAETLKSVKNKYFKPEDLKGSTFTVTNLGMVGILEFTAIINPPNSAILSVGTVVHRMRLYEGEPMMRSVMKISLNLDNRVADGLTGAKFLQDVKADMENPSLLLLEKS